MSSKRDSLVKNPDESLLSTSRRGSHRQSRNQVSPQEEEEVECLNSKVGSGRQSRMLSPELEYVKRGIPPREREWTGRGEEVVSFERETVSKPKRRSGEGGGLCENREEIEKTMNGYCEDQEVTRRCNPPLLLPKSPQRNTEEMEKTRSMNKDQEEEEVVRRCNENDLPHPPPPPPPPLPQRPPDPSLLVLPTEVT